MIFPVQTESPHKCFYLLAPSNWEGRGGRLNVRHLMETAKHGDDRKWLNQQRLTDECLCAEGIPLESTAGRMGWGPSGAQETPFDGTLESHSCSSLGVNLL